MFQLDLKSRKSIYEQVVDHIKELIVTGILKTDEKLPSVRELSKRLTINPNTVQKAYRELEHQGFVYTVSGLGCFVSPPQYRSVNDQLLREIKDNIRSNLKELQYLGLEREDISALIGELLEEGGI